jgi:murein DD-endopeptidase MepM/ murein hydrolase activator NlpD
MLIPLLLLALVAAIGGASASPRKGDLAKSEVSSVGFAADPLKDKQRKVRHQLAAAKDDLGESSARARRTQLALVSARNELAAAEAALEAAQARVAAAQARDQEMQERLELSIAELLAAQQAVAAGKQQVVAKRGDIADFVVDAYQEGDPQLLSIAALFNSVTAADLTRDAQTRSIMVGEETSTYDALRAAEASLKVQEAKVEAAKVEAAQRRVEAAQQLEARRSLEQQAASAAANVRASVERSREAKAAADAARAADLREIRALKREEEQVAEMLRKRAEAARNKHSGSVRDPDGFLNYPSGGAITSGFGYRRHPIYGYWGLHDGVDFGANCGSPLYAAADGEVVSAYWSTSYGNRLIIDNGYARGVGLATIYNHAIRYTVGVGQRVERGEVIGYVGSTGWSTGCHLHFTVMVNGRAVDPMRWL